MGLNLPLFAALGLAIQENNSSGCNLWGNYPKETDCIKLKWPYELLEIPYMGRTIKVAIDKQ